MYDILDLEDCPTLKLQRCQEIHATRQSYEHHMPWWAHISFRSLPWTGPACASQNGRRYQYPQNLHGSTSAAEICHTKPWDFVVTSAFTKCIALRGHQPTVHSILSGLLNSWSSRACCLFDHIWSRLDNQNEPNLHQISCFCARVHYHRSCLWCWEPQAWYTSSTTWDTQKHCPEWLIL